MKTYFSPNKQSLQLDIQFLLEVYDKIEPKIIEKAELWANSSIFTYLNDGYLKVDILGTSVLNEA